MKCAKDYQAVISADGRLAFVIPAGKDEPHSPKLIYNGGESALLYRSAADILVLDKLHEEAQKALCRKRSVVIIEADYAGGKTVYDADTVYNEQLPYLPKNFQGVKGLEFFLFP